MKKIIKIAVNQTVVNHVEKEIDFPETEKYYSKIDNGRICPRGIILFAIIPYKNRSNPSYTLLEIERNKQDYTDFIPQDDCRQEYWIKNFGLRKTALQIITNSIEPGFMPHGFTEISKEEFNDKRMELLNNYNE